MLPRRNSLLTALSFFAISLTILVATIFFTHDKKKKKAPSCASAPPMTTTSHDNNDNNMDKKTALLESVVESPKPSLTDITAMDPSQKCTEGLEMISNILPPKSSLPSSKRKIPPIVHQSSKTRCITPTMAGFVQGWTTLIEEHNDKHKKDAFSYYFHDDDAVDRFLDAFEWPMFPLLKPLIQNCVVSKTTKSDLWRYLLLWEYGGIYTDMDTIPTTNFTLAKTIGSEDDGYFIMEFGGFLSQYFMAMSPRHPLMFYSLHHALWGILHHKDTGLLNAAWVTGPHGALKPALQSFMSDANVVVTNDDLKRMEAKLYVGSYGRSFVLDGEALEQSDNIIQREGIKAHIKQQEYEKMGMTHFKWTMKGESNTSCVRALYLEHLAQGGVK